MDRFCPNCGRPMDKYDPLCGPGGMGCLYCTKHCPNRHREVFDQDIIYGESKEYCRYCRAKVEKEESQALENVLDDDHDYDDDSEDINLENDFKDIDEETLNKFRNMTKEEQKDYINGLYAEIVSRMGK